MKEQKLADDSREKISDPKDDLVMTSDSFALYCKQNQLALSSRFGVINIEVTEQLNYRRSKSMICDLCRNLSILVQMENENETQTASANKSYDAQEAEDTANNVNDDFRVRMIINLSKVIMDFLGTDNAPNLPPEEVDHIVLGCLLDTYRLPSVANVFESETADFYEWWRWRIKEWIWKPFSNNNQSSSCYQLLGWRHLTAMIRETRDHLRPPPLSIMVSRAGSKEVNGEYKLVHGCSSSLGNGLIQHQGKEQQIFYPFYDSRKVTYEKNTIDGRTFSLCLCGVDKSPTSAAEKGTGHSLWFLTELDEEQPNTDCDIDYYCALPRNGKRKRTNPVPPLSGWNRCSQGLFPPPRLVPSGAVGLEGTDERPDTHWKRLARWILKDDLLANCRWWCIHKPRNDDVDSGYTSVLEFLIDVYEEGEKINPGETAGSSMGTELFVKFAMSCLEGQKQRAQC